MKAATCVTNPIDLGYQCILQLRKITASTSYYNLVLLVSFLSSGSVTKIKILNGAFAAADSITKFALPNGGYLLMYKKTVREAGRLLIDGEIFNNDDVLDSRWDIPENLTIPFPYVVIYNNFEKTFEIISEITQTTFTIISSTFPEFNNNNGKFIYFLRYCILNTVYTFF
jgi:hypothetical protein